MNILLDFVFLVVGIFLGVSATLIFTQRVPEYISARQQVLQEIYNWCTNESLKYTIGPDAPAYHIYRDVAVHILKEMNK